MKKEIPVLALLAASLLLSCPAYALSGTDWTFAICENTTWLHVWEDVKTSDGLYEASSLIPCKFGCDNNTQSCKQPYILSGAQVSFSFPLYIFLFIGGLGTLWFSLAKKRVVFAIAATVLFMVLAFQSTALESVLAYTPFSGLAFVFVGISWLLVMVSLFAALLGMVKTLQKPGEDELGEGGR